MLERLIERLKEHSKKIRVILFLTLISILTTIIIKNITEIDLTVIIQHGYITLLIFLFATILISIKSFQLKSISDTFTKPKSYPHFIKTYCMSSFIELTTFTGKIGSDGFKYIYWKDIPQKEKIGIIITQRSADIMGFILLILAFFKPLLLIPLIIITIIVYRYTNYKNHENIIIKNLHLHWKVWTLMLIISISSYLIMATQLSLIFYTLGVQINRTLISGFLFSHGAGAISQLPLGIGAKDLSILYILKESLSTQTILIGLIWARLCGEFLSIFLGAAFTGIELLKKKRDNTSQ